MYTSNSIHRTWNIPSEIDRTVPIMIVTTKHFRAVELEVLVKHHSECTAQELLLSTRPGRGTTKDRYFGREVRGPGGLPWNYRWIYFLDFFSGNTIIRYRSVRRSPSGVYSVRLEHDMEPKGCWFFFFLNAQTCTEEVSVLWKTIKKKKKHTRLRRRVLFMTGKYRGFT